MPISVDFGGIFKMTDRVCCGFARVFLWKTKAISLNNITHVPYKTKAQFNKRVLEERFNLYIEQFQDYKPLLMDKGKQTCSLRESLLNVHFYTKDLSHSQLHS